MGAATRLRDRRRPSAPQSAESLKIETGSLYPALHRLEKQGWVKAEWRQTEANQRAKFYRLTAEGQEAAPAGTRSLVAAGLGDRHDPQPETQHGG